VKLDLLIRYDGRLMRLFDTHAHLHFPEFGEDLDAVLERARAAGVAAMVTVGTDRETNPAAVALAERLTGVYATVGIHPHDAADATEDDVAAMERLSRSSAKVLALGEMGLDFFRDLSPRPRQREMFRRQLALARALGKPVVVHCREAHAETLDILAGERVGEVGGVMHCFSGDVAVAKRCLDLGLMISLAGPVTYRNARALPEVARFVPDDRLVMETDCPFLPPHPHRGRRNEPAWMTLTAERIAELRGVDGDALGDTVTRNAAALFRLPAEALEQLLAPRSS
jgi:TatD DNase family protein